MPLLLALALVLAAASPASARTLHVAPGGSDANDCATPVTACASFDRGYHAAAPGDVVQLAGGTYPGPQLFSEDASKTAAGADVVVRPAPGAHVLIDCDFENNCLATEGADHLLVEGVTTAMLAPIDGKARQSGVSLDRGSDHVTFRGVDAGHIFVAARNASVIGGDYGPTVDRVSKIADDVGENVLIDGARFHNHLYKEQHMECIALYGARGVVIRRSHFDTCWAFAIFGAPGVDEHYRDVLIENNFFTNSGDASMSSHVKISSHGGDCSNFLIRNNSFIDENVIAHCGIELGTATNMRWISNIFSQYNTRDNCEDTRGAHWFDYNVVEDGHACGPHDVEAGIGGAGFVDRAGLDLRLATGSPAIDRGSPEHPATDIDGNPRPFGAAADAGADEFGSTGGTPPAAGLPGAVFPGGLGADRAAPRLELRVARRQSLGKLLRRGRLAFRARCSEPCRLLARLRAGRSAARRIELGGGAQRVGSGRKRLNTAGTSRKVLVGLEPRVLRRLADVRRVRLTLRATASDAAGNARTVKRRIAFAR